MNNFKGSFSAEPNFNREERILILPHNTLRWVDVLYECKLKHVNGIKLPDFDTLLFKSVSRKEKDLHKIYNYFPSSLEKEFKDKWAYYYDIAPRSKFYEYLDILNHQKFISQTYVLFDDENAKDPAFENLYYDGSISELEEVIQKYKITCLVFDDIDLIKTLIDRGNINLDNMTLFVSKAGYNYKFDSDINELVPKHTFYEIELKAVLEMGIITLFEFKESTINKIKSRGKF